jgi:ABC-2 type transport system permease protein
MRTVASEPELREVTGPSALGGGSRRFFDLLWLMSVTEFRRAYFGTVFGYVWSLLRPLMLFGVLLFVFTRVFKIGHDLRNYPVLLLLGIVQFTFFQEASTNAVTSVVSQEGVVRKTQFPRLVIPLATVLTAAFNFCLNLVVVFVFILAWGVDPTWTWLLFPVAMVALFVLTAAVSMLLSSLFVRFRDVAIIWTVAAQMLFYATPVLYPLGPKGINDPARSPLRAGANLGPLRTDQRRPKPCHGRRWQAPPPAGGGDLRRRLCTRSLVLQPRGAEDRRGPLGPRWVRTYP